MVVHTWRLASSSDDSGQQLWAVGGGRVDGRRELKGRDGFGGKADFKNGGKLLDHHRK